MPPPTVPPFSRALPLVVLGLAALALPARAQTRLEGTGRVALMGGWRLTPNGALLQRAVEAGRPLGEPSRGGPIALASFAYAPTELLDVAIDLYASGERLWRPRDGAPAAQVLNYGALLGLRAQWLTGPIGPLVGLQPAVGVHTGPMLVLAEEGSQRTEVLSQAWAASAALTGRVAEQWGLSLEYRFVLAEGRLGVRGSFNAGGHWLLLGVTLHLPPERHPRG